MSLKVRLIFYAYSLDWTLDILKSKYGYQNIRIYICSFFFFTNMWIWLFDLTVFNFFNGQMKYMIVVVRSATENLFYVPKPKCKIFRNSFAYSGYKL